MRVRIQRSYTKRLRDTLRDAGQRLRAGVSRKPRPGPGGAQHALAASGSGSRPPHPLPNDPAVLVEVMLCADRYGLLLRQQLVGNLSAEQRARAAAALSRQMALVEVGPVVIVAADSALAEQDYGAADSATSGEAVVVEPYYLDRQLVTNQQFQQFVAAGGYEQSTIWDQEVWPVVAEFVDRSGAPGPRFWNRGRFEAGMELHPVVGVSWYEASAYARWLGKRLPSDTEWVRAACAPLLLPGGELRQRKYPWGEQADRTRALLWGANPAGTARVDAFPRGDSPAGIRQLIGNVWEWNAGDFDQESFARLWPDGSLRSTAMKSLRGGAFDTYFDAQATCQFQSGDHPLARKHNIGLRCALSAEDVQLSDEAAETAEPYLAEAEA
jgi:gamma-glutamyl hercynylcysteine S-oxide synthase